MTKQLSNNRLNKQIFPRILLHAHFPFGGYCSSLKEISSTDTIKLPRITVSASSPRGSTSFTDVKKSQNTGHFILKNTYITASVVLFSSFADTVTLSINITSRLENQPNRENGVMLDRSNREADSVSFASTIACKADLDYLITINRINKSPVPILWEYVQRDEEWFMGDNLVELHDNQALSDTRVASTVSNINQLMLANEQTDLAILSSGVLIEVNVFMVPESSTKISDKSITVKPNVKTSLYLRGNNQRYFLIRTILRWQ